MDKATITFSMNEDGNIDVKVDFGDGMDESNMAHHEAVRCLTTYINLRKQEQENDLS